jgi:hypothetical protein
MGKATGASLWMALPTRPSGRLNLGRYTASGLACGLKCKDPSTRASAVGSKTNWPAES